MIQLTTPVSLATINEVAEFQVIILIDSFTIGNGYKLIAPEGNSDFDQVVADLAAKEMELAAGDPITTPTSTQQANRLRRLKERDDLIKLRDSYMIKDEGVATCSVRYFAKNENREIRLPIEGLSESFSAYCSDLSVYDGGTSGNVYVEKRTQMERLIIGELALTGFLGFSSIGDYEILV